MPARPIAKMLTVAGLLAAVAAIAPATAGAAKPVKPLRITNVHSVRDYFGRHSEHTVFTARAPGSWKIIRPSSCTATGFDRNGGKHAGHGYGGYGSHAKIRFKHGVEVRSRLKVRCPTLRRTYWTTKTVQRWAWRYKVRKGVETTSRSTRGNCHIDRDFFGHGLELDCWGGRYATASYRFHLPGDARGIHRSARGSYGCCARGHVTRDWHRTSSGNPVYRVHVTNWRAYTVRKVSVRYLTRVSHRVRHRHRVYAVGKGRRG
jgi:hypothetical protein